MAQHINPRRDDATLTDDGGIGVSLSGTVNQIDLAKRIRVTVYDEFDDIAASFRQVAAKQGVDARGDTEAIIAILEEKRAQVMQRTSAGYFISYWREITDQVRQMIFHDARYPAIRKRQVARRSPKRPSSPG
jgi:hypothetical protein